VTPSPLPQRALYAAEGDGARFRLSARPGLRCMVEMLIRRTEGFAVVLAGARALLEHWLLLQLVPDRFADGLPEQ